MKRIVLLIVLLFIVASTIIAQTTKPGWRLQTSLPTGVSGQRSATLPGGRVIITGGIANGGSSTAQCWIYNYKSGAIEPLADFVESRAWHSLVVVPVGPARARIFAIGGYAGTPGAYSSIDGIEVLDYDAAQPVYSWKKVGRLAAGRGDCSAVWDKASSIVVAGGESLALGSLHTGTTLVSSEIIGINPPYVVAAIGPMGVARAGGFLCTISNNDNTAEVLASSCELPAVTSTERLEGLSWVNYANPPKQYRMRPAYFADIAGVARMFGGAGESGSALNTCEWYDVAKQLWKYSSSMIYPRAEAGVMLIASESDSVPCYMIAGGNSSGGKTASVEYYTLPTFNDPAGTWTQFYSLNTPGSGRSINMTGSNLPLVAGGEDASNSPVAGVEIFQPLSAPDLSFPGATEVGGLADSIAVDIKNNWLLPVTPGGFRFEGTAAFFFTGDTSKFVLAPGASRRIYVWFLPNTEGLSSANLLFNIDGLTDTVKVSGAATKSSIGVITANMDFGEVFVGDGSEQCFEAIKNIGTDTTTIDSISIAPAPDYTLLSPIGRVLLPPDSTLNICVRFAPTARREISGTAIMNIAKRRFGVWLGGRGVLAYIKSFGQLGCDTVNYAAGAVFNSIITLRNPGDRPVNVVGDMISGGAWENFTIDPSVYPFTLDPGARRDIQVTFMPPAEGMFSVNVDFINDGAADSASTCAICLAAISRDIALSLKSIDFSTLCVGDSASATLLIENPGYYESISLDSARILETPTDASVSGFVAQTLAPLNNTSLIISYKPIQPGPKSCTLVIYGSFGSVRVNIGARALAPLLLSGMGDVHALPPQTVALPFEIIPAAGQSITGLGLSMNYDKRLLKPLRLRSMNAAPLDMSLSSMNPAGDGALGLVLSWLAPVTQPSEAFAVEFETLAGSYDRSTVTVEGAPGNDYCIRGAAVLVLDDPGCPGSPNLIATGSKVLLQVAHPASGDEYINLTISKNYEGDATIIICNSLGQSLPAMTLGETHRGVYHRIIDVAILPAGVYFCTVAAGGVPLAT